MRRHRVLLLGALVGAAALATSACSTVDPAAATVNGEDISRADFQDELEAFASNDAYIAAQTTNGLTVLGDGADAVTADFARGTLQTAILYELADQARVERGLALDDDVRAFARSLVEQDFAPDVLAAFPDDLVQGRVDGYANLVALALSLGGEQGFTTAMQARYDADPGRYATRCLSHILSDDEAGAEAVLDRLEAGEDFGAVAADASTDPSAAQNQGELGCFTVEDGSLDPDFTQAAFTAEEGVPTRVTTQFGEHVVLVTSSEPRSFEEAANALQGDVLNDVGPGLNEFIDEALAEADVDVDARYGRWDPDELRIVEGEAGARPPVTIPGILPAS